MFMLFNRTYVYFAHQIVFFLFVDKFSLSILCLMIEIILRYNFNKKKPAFVYIIYCFINFDMEYEINFSLCLKSKSLLTTITICQREIKHRSKSQFFSRILHRIRN